MRYVDPDGHEGEEADEETDSDPQQGPPPEHEPIVQGALKISEAFRALVRAYRSGIAQDYKQVAKLAGDAWNLAARARELAPNLAGIADQVQKIAKGMADSARQLMEQPAQ